MKHRSVVANFIFKWSDAERLHQQVALFRRSKHPNIRSYQDKYAPISGSIEEDDANPVTAAEREILEETTLKVRHDIHLEFVGQPYSFEDQNAQRSWTVHPFGWILTADEAKIKIDWEHSGWKWFDPQDVLNGSMDQVSVPRLGESLRRVYFGPNGMFMSDPPIITRTSSAGRIFLATIDDLRTDTENGARVLATKAIVRLKEMLQNFGEESTGETTTSDRWRDLKVAAYQLIHTARPAMNSAIENAIISCLDEIINKLQPSDYLSPSALQLFETCVAERKEMIAELAKHFADYICKKYTDDSSGSVEITIFTLSSSSTIVAALTQLLQTIPPSSKINLVVFESRPQCEGATMAATLASEYRKMKGDSADTVPTLKIRVAPDSHMTLCLEKLEPEEMAIVLLGADRITPTGHTSNKTGSASLAVLAKTLAPDRVQVIVVSERDKIAKADMSMMNDYGRIVWGNHGPGEFEMNKRRLEDYELKTHSHEQHDASELSGAWSKQAQETLLPLCQNDQTDSAESGKEARVSIDNVYFEFVHAKYIDTFISEAGEDLKVEMPEQAVYMAELEDQLFKDLYTENTSS